MFLFLFMYCISLVSVVPVVSKAAVVGAILNNTTVVTANVMQRGGQVRRSVGRLAWSAWSAWSAAGWSPGRSLCSRCPADTRHRRCSGSYYAARPARLDSKIQCNSMNTAQPKPKLGRALKSNRNHPN